MFCNTSTSRSRITSTKGVRTQFLLDGDRPLRSDRADVTSLRPPGGINPKTAIALTALAMDLPGLGKAPELAVDCALTGTSAKQPAGRRDLERGTHQPDRIGVAVVLHERGIS